VEASLATSPGGPGRKAGSRSSEAATEDVRGYAMGSVRGRELRCRVAPRGGALDRGPARTAQRVVPVFSSIRANTLATGHALEDLDAVVRPKLEVRRQAKLHP